jgi:hypothetical protein
LPPRSSPLDPPSSGLALEQFDRNAFRRAQEGNAHTRPHRRRPPGELDALRFEFGDQRIDAVDREPEMIEPLVRRERGRVDAVAGSTGAMKMLAPPSLRSMRGLPCCMLRTTSAPSMRSYHWAVASGLGVRK